MKRPFIWKAKHKDFRILWIWRIALIYCNKVEDEKSYGIWKTKLGILIFIKNKGIGIGHSFGIEPKAYQLDKQ